MAPGGKTGSLLISIAYLVGAVGIEIASHFSKSNKDNGVALPPLF